MDGAALTGSCVAHLERTGTPCARCGTFRCGECLNDSGLCRDCSERQGAHTPQGDETVGFGRRVGARLIDTVFIQVCGGLGGFAGGLVLFVLGELGLLRQGWADRLGSPGFLFEFSSGVVAGLLGAAVGVAVAGISPGKLVLGLRVVNAQTGERASFAAGLLRELGYYVDGLFFGLVAKAAMDSSPLKQRYGDQWARTAVVRRASLTTHVAGSAGRVALGLFAFAAVHVTVIGAFTIAHVVIR